MCSYLPITILYVPCYLEVKHALVVVPLLLLHEPAQQTKDLSVA